MTSASNEKYFPIFLIGGKYFLFDIKIVAYAREQHHIVGVLIGSIPQAKDQNTFNGLPLQLLEEEVCYLVKNRHAYVVDDVVEHQKPRSLEDRQALHTELNAIGLEIAQERDEEIRRKKQLIAEKHNLPVIATNVTTEKVEPMVITPVSSYTSSRAPIPNPPLLLPITKSYPLFELLHSKGYFMTPGLRFGCHFSCYPGDPLRYHSHFLAIGKEWDEPIPLLDIVAGGRLGTGVKKSYLFGGRKSPENDFDGNDDGNKMNDEQSQEPTRAFSIEWAAM